jgi:hypothetical protein
MWLLYQEVLGCNEPAADYMLNFYNELLYVENTTINQPYYSRHPWVHLMRGEVKAFLKAYYFSMSSVADRETYTFRENPYSSNSHKTHEEGWFLMETRWMLYLEDGETLKLLPGVPRRWMENGERIELKNVASRFGHFDLNVESRLAEGAITAELIFNAERKPMNVQFRLPHPQGRKAVSSEGGIYDAASETVMISNFNGEARIVLNF